MIYQEDDETLTGSTDPALISSFWAEWVCVVCGWEKIPEPSTDEWAKLKATFYYDKAPVDSVAELKKMREAAKQGGQQ